MSSNLLLQVKEAMVRYTDKPVFENLTFNMHENKRIALVGKNGAGKSTLMNIITGSQDLDEGQRWVAPNVTIGYLRQDIQPREGKNVFDFIFEDMNPAERELHTYKVDIIAAALELDPTTSMTKLSGGQIRRAGLARALVEEPDILLLDEPTNHLDLGIIQWLEDYLQHYRGTLLVVSHDRAFLSNVTNQVFWLDRGGLRVSPKGFKHFDEWAEMLLEQEARELSNRKAQVAEEVEWASRGVKARVKRNQRRLQQMREMRDQLKQDEASYRRSIQKIEFKPLKNPDTSSKIVAEFYNVHKSFQDGEKETKILEKFSHRIVRGDRIGLLGKNGSGKTTFLKLLMGELEPDAGRVKIKKDLEFSYFDQKRSNLNPDISLKKVLSPEGSDYIDVMGKQRHVYGYLKDFMFDPSRAEDKVKGLSGGQKNRLMLAKVLANPKSCLILDEPTNDLDMETLDMLEEILSHYKGTLIVVSHDRDFLDQTVTKILAFEGEGRIEAHAGGASEYLDRNSTYPANQTADTAPSKSHAQKATSKKDNSNTQTAPTPPLSNNKAQKLSYKDARDLQMLPDLIEQSEQRINQLEKMLADPDFYRQDPDSFHHTTQELARLQTRLSEQESRWLSLEEKRKAIEDHA